METAISIDAYHIGVTAFHRGVQASVHFGERESVLGVSSIAHYVGIAIMYSRAQAPMHICVRN